MHKDQLLRDTEKKQTHARSLQRATLLAQRSVLYMQARTVYNRPLSA
jgi:hypothetical protein